VPRIVKSKTRFLSIIWLLGVFTCGGFLIWQVVVILNRYFSRPVNTLLFQAPGWQKPTFPDVTVCNSCPLVNDKDILLSYSDYISILRQKISYDEFVGHFPRNVNISNEDYMSFMGRQAEPMSYFRNFPIVSKAVNEEVQNGSLTINCAYFKWDYTLNNFMCMTNIKTIWDPDYYKCYTMSLSTSERQNVRGFSAIYHVAEFLNNQLVDFNMNLDISRSTGLRVLVHTPGTVPNMKLGISVSPGTETTVKLYQSIRSHLPDPYSNCTEQKTLGSSIYTQQYCLDVCLQDQALQECGCILGTWQYTDQQLERANYTICGNISINTINSVIKWEGFQKQICIDTFQANSDACDKTCLMPCSEYHYTQVTSSAPWPHISTEASFYVAYLRSGNFGTRFEKYDDLLSYIAFNNTAAVEFLAQLDKEGLIKRNFLQLNVLFESSTFNEQRDVATFPLDAMSAQIGGVLSLWLGVTVMLFFEVCEFFYILLTELWSKRRAQSHNVAEQLKNQVVNPRNMNEMLGNEQLTDIKCVI